VKFTLSYNNNNFQFNGSCTESPIVTVSTKVDGFVTGGGYIIPTNSGGAIGGTPVNGLKNNFGFNCKFNKAGKLQGTWNTIIRRREGDQVVTYQVKSNTAKTLVVTENGTRADITFTSANFQNLTCSLCPVGANNGTVILTVWDLGEPGGGIDKILITIKDRNGNVWYTNDAAGSHSSTNETQPLLAKGNIQIHVLGVAGRLEVNGAMTSLNASFGSIENFALRALPNPSSSQFTLQLQSDNTREAMQLKVTDLMGRTIEARNNLVPNGTIQVGAAYKPGVYFVELSQGGKKQQVKLIKF
jgi:hypothetical protein